MTAVKTQPEGAARPAHVRTGLVRAESMADMTTARASGAIGHLLALFLHQSAKLSKACSKPFACASPDATESSVGSIAPSRTKARTRVGKSWAYTAPSSVPYEYPR